MTTVATVPIVLFGRIGPADGLANTGTRTVGPNELLRADLGVPPSWSPTEDGTAFLHALQVYDDTDSVAQVDRTGLTSLLSASS